MRPVFARSRRWLGLWFAALVAFGAAAAPLASVAAPTSIDRRVTAIPSATLLALPGAALVDPRRQRAAVRFRSYNRPVFFLWALAQVAAFFFFWSSGAAARLRDRLRAAFGNTFAFRFAFGACLTVLAGLAALPANLVRYRIDLAFGLTTQNAAGWLRDGFVTAGVDAFVVGTIVACVFALVDRTRLWYLWAMGGLFVVTLLMAFAEPVIVAPLYNRFKPLAQTARVRAPLAALAKRAGIGDAPIYVADDSRRTTAAIADVAGFGPTKRIVLSDALLVDATTGEIVFLVAREFGHYAHHDDFRLSLFWTFLFILCTALAVVASDRVAFRRDDDPLARLSLAFAFLGTFALIATPLYNAYSRNLEAQADGYAIALTGDRAPAVRAYVRIADETLATLCPGRFTGTYFANSPALGSRIARASRRPDPCR